MLVKTYLLNWIDTYCVPRLASNTVKFYSNLIYNHIIPHIGDLRVEKLKSAQIENLYAALFKEGLAGTTVLAIHRTLHKAFNTGLKTRVLTENITDFVYAPIKSRFSAQVLTTDQLLLLLHALEGSEIYLPVLLASCLGLRRGESLGLRWSDIDFTYHTITVSQSASFYRGGITLSDTKTIRSNRTLKLPLTIYNVLFELNKKPPDLIKNPLGLITLKKNGYPITSGSLQYQYKQILKVNQLPNIRFHDLRHTFATLLLKNNISPKITSSYLGHSNIGITLDLYSHVLTEMQEPIIEVIDNLLHKADISAR